MQTALQSKCSCLSGLAWSCKLVIAPETVKAARNRSIQNSSTFYDNFESRKIGNTRLSIQIFCMGSRNALPCSEISSAQSSNLGDLYTESGQMFQGSFSALSKPVCATKFSLDSSCRDLHNAFRCTALKSQFVSEFS